MKLEIGMYVRTVLGISKLVEIKNNDSIYVFDKLDENLWTDDIADEIWECELKDIVVKASYNIIDILETGDYVNGLPVECVEGTWDDENDKRVYYGVATYGHKSNLPYHTYIVKDEFENDYDLRFRCIKPNEIKSIVTKEQMEQMAYKVVE